MAVVVIVAKLIVEPNKMIVVASTAGRGRRGQEIRSGPSTLVVVIVDTVVVIIVGIIGELVGMGLVI